MDKEKVKGIRPFILPVITLILIFALFTFYLPGKTNSKTNNVLTGFFSREPSYLLGGSVLIKDVNLEKDGNCTVFLSVYSLDKVKKIENYSLSMGEFLKKAEKKDQSYIFNLNNLNISLTPGNYSLKVLISCNGQEISSEQEIKI